MKFSEMFPSRFLKAADLEEADLTLTIKSIDEGDAEIGKPIVYFEEHDRGLVLNVTNGRVLVGAFGDEMSNWPGRSITLFAAPTQFEGRPVQSIRVRIPRKAVPNGGGAKKSPDDSYARAKGKPSGNKPPPVDTDLDDSIPF